MGCSSQIRLMTPEQFEAFKRARQVVHNGTRCTLGCEDFYALHEDYEAGATLDELGKRIGHSGRYVLDNFKRLGLHVRNISEVNRVVSARRNGQL